MRGGAKRSLGGDATKLRFADGLTKTERELLRSVQHISSKLPGTQEVRQLMGHALFGARVIYGDGLFITISPSDRHAGLTLRLSRYRQNDPVLNGSAMSRDLALRLASRNYPALEETDNVVDLPDYVCRKLWNAQDSMSIVDGFSIWVRVVFARLAGLRMCPRCPRCNVDPRTACQNAFGSNATMMGGVFGACEAFAGAVEYQRSGTPHLHGKLHVASVFQQNSCGAEYTYPGENATARANRSLDFLGMS